MSDLLKYFPKPTEEGDIGAALLGIAIGFFGDSLLSVHLPWLRIPPETAGIYFGAAVLGTKESIQAILKAATALKPNSSIVSEPKSEIAERARKLSRLLHDAVSVGAPIADIVGARERLDLDLLLLEEGVISPEELEVSISATLKVFREFRLGVRVGPSPRVLLADREQRALDDPTQGL